MQFDRMKRREFIWRRGCVATGRTRAATSDAGDRVPQVRIAGCLRAVSAFRQGLSEIGYVEDRNAAIAVSLRLQHRLP